MNFIFYSVTGNYESFHRKREIEALATYRNDSVSNKVLYFNVPQFFLKTLLKKRKNKYKKAIITKNIYIKSLFTLLPISFALKNKWLMYFFITLPIRLQVSIFKKVCFGKQGSINWFYKPDQYLYLKNNGPYIYLHYDNYQGDEAYKFHDAANFEITLNECVKNSLFTLVSSSKLFERYKELNPGKVFYYPNAISRDILSDKIYNKNIDSKDIIIGFIGQLDNTFDFELIEKLAESSNNYKIILIGAVKNTAGNNLIEQYKNVELLGYLDYERLAEKIMTFDVGICPYSFSDFNQYRNPLKIIEYFSYGIPVVTVKCDISKSTQNLLGIAENHQHFIELIKKEVATDSAQKRLARKSFAASNCWDNRADFIFKKLSLITT